MAWHIATSFPTAPLESLHTMQPWMTLPRWNQLVTGSTNINNFPMTCGQSATRLSTATVSATARLDMLSASATHLCFHCFRCIFGVTVTEISDRSYCCPVILCSNTADRPQFRSICSLQRLSTSHTQDQRLRYWNNCSSCQRAAKH